MSVVSLLDSILLEEESSPNREIFNKRLKYLIEIMIEDQNLEKLKILLDNRDIREAVGKHIYDNGYTVLNLVLCLFLNITVTDSAYQMLEFILETFPELVNKPYHGMVGLETPLLQALSFYYINSAECYKVLKSLIDHGADTELECLGETIFSHYKRIMGCTHYGCVCSSNKIYELLLGGGGATKDARK